ncbi:MAG: hypothetical protein ACOYIG_04470, partial [Acetivibrionales bacterium]
MDLFITVVLTLVGVTVGAVLSWLIQRYSEYHRSCPIRSWRLKRRYGYSGLNRVGSGQQISTIFER